MPEPVLVSPHPTAPSAPLGRRVREAPHGRKGGVVWLTGLSGAGKSTLAGHLQQALLQRQCSTYLLDGDQVRQGLCCDLGFSDADRRENIRRIGEVARLLAEAGVIAIVACISPFEADRNAVRNRIGAHDFLEVHVHVPLEVAEQRDPKGLYQKARAGVLSQFTGIDSLYEPPVAPDLVLQSDQMSVEECVERLLIAVNARFVNEVD